MRICLNKQLLQFECANDGDSLIASSYILNQYLKKGDKMNTSDIEYIENKKIIEYEYFVLISLEGNTSVAIEIEQMILFAHANRFDFNSITFENNKHNYLFLKNH